MGIDLIPSIKEMLEHADLEDMPDILGGETSHDARYARKALAEAITGAWTFPTIVITDGAGHFLQVPQLTTAQRNALTPVNGMVIYNTTTTRFERYQGGAWGAFGVSDHGGLAGLGDDDHGQYLNIARHDLTTRHPLGTVVPHDALANLSEKAHSSLTGIGVSDHHVKTGDNEVYGLLAAGAAASRPAPGISGRFYFSTDTLVLERDNGAAWVEMARGETAIRLAQLAERAHGSLTGVTANQHHARSHDHSNALDGSPIALAGVPSLSTAYDKSVTFFQTLSTEWVVITGSNQSIVVGAGEKVVALVYGFTANNTASAVNYVGLFRGDTQIGFVAVQPIEAGRYVMFAIMECDAPAASTYTYQLKGMVTEGIGYFYPIGITYLLVKR